MATTVSQPDKAPWPHGKLVPIHLRSALVGGDTSALTILDIYKTKFDFKVKKAYFSVREGSVAIEANAGSYYIRMQIVDNQDTPQTIVAAKDIDADDDAGVTVALTVASHNVIHAEEQLALDVYSNHANNTIADLHVTLMVEPVYS